MTEEAIQTIYDMSAERIRETETSFHRYLYDQIDWDARVVALDGPRGVGKTTMFLQHLRENPKQSDTSLYVSIDNVWLNAQEMYELAQYHVRHGGDSIFIDEIHYLADWQNLIKSLYARKRFGDMFHFDDHIAHLTPLSCCLCWLHLYLTTVI